MKDVKTGEFCWNELLTSDVSTCKQFYKSLFGWEAHDHDMGHMTYTLLKSGDKDVGGMMQIPQGHEQQVPPNWLSYIYVEDLNAKVEQAKSLGATIKQPPTDISDFGRFAVIQDPTGACFALWQSLKACD